MKKAIIPVLAVLVLTGCAQKEYSEDFFAMNTVMRITGRGSNAEQIVVSAEQRINELDRLLSRTRSESEIWALNHANGEWVTVSADTLSVLQTALTVAEQTDGAYDPTVAPLTDLWQIGTEQAHIPAQSEIEFALETVGWQNVEVKGDQVRLKNGAEIDLGGVAKGWAGANVVDPENLTGGLLELGGNISCFGKKADGADTYTIGVANPNDPANYIALASMQDGCAVTTGDYERFFEQDGVRYHHVFDPATGAPARSGLRSVTVLMDYEDGAWADGYSTALFVMGLDEGMRFCEEKNLAAVFVTADSVVYVTEAARDTVQFRGEEYDFALAD